MEQQKQIFTTDEATEFLRISRATLWRERKAGKISFSRAASKIIYTIKDLESYIESTKRHAFGVSVEK